MYEYNTRTLQTPDRLDRNDSHHDVETWIIPRMSNPKMSNPIMSTMHVPECLKCDNEGDHH